MCPWYFYVSPDRKDQDLFTEILVFSTKFVNETENE